MIRIYSVLACLSVALLCVTMMLGLFTGDHNGASREFLEEVNRLETEERALKEQRPRPKEQLEAIKVLKKKNKDNFAPFERHALTHMWFGVSAALVAVLVNSIGLTYFVGTSRWVKEVVETYDYDIQWIARSEQNKRGTWPWALAGMLMSVGIIALGAAAHPGTARQGTEDWVTAHLFGSMFGIAFIAFAFYIQARNINANYQLIQQVVELVQSTRRDKGLDREDLELPTSPAESSTQSSLAVED